MYNRIQYTCSTITRPEPVVLQTFAMRQCNPQDIIDRWNMQGRGHYSYQVVSAELVALADIPDREWVHLDRDRGCFAEHLK